MVTGSGGVDDHVDHAALSKYAPSRQFCRLQSIIGPFLHTRLFRNILAGREIQSLLPTSPILSPATTKHGDSTEHHDHHHCDDNDVDDDKRCYIILRHKYGTKKTSESLTGITPMTFHPAVG